MQRLPLFDKLSGTKLILLFGELPMRLLVHDAYRQYLQPVRMRSPTPRGWSPSSTVVIGMGSLIGIEIVS